MNYGQSVSSAGLVDSDPYGELARYLKIRRTEVDAVYRTLC